MPPFTAPARKLHEETSSIAAAQDAKLDRKPDPVAAVLTSHALKYLMRWPRKGGITDLRKCQWYLARLIARVEAADCKDRRTQLDAFATDKPPLEPSRIGTPAELNYLASFGPNNNAHPMHAEALRYRDEHPPEDLL
jgi:hypothetical protein